MLFYNFNFEVTDWSLTASGGPETEALLGTASKIKIRVSCHFFKITEVSCIITGYFNYTFPIHIFFRSNTRTFHTCRDRSPMMATNALRFSPGSSKPLLLKLLNRGEKLWSAATSKAVHLACRLPFFAKTSPFAQHFPTTGKSLYSSGITVSFCCKTRIDNVSMEP